MEKFRGRQDHLNVQLTPQEARQKLADMGIRPKEYDILAEQKDFGSHELRALLEIAQQGQPQNLKDIYVAQRRKDFPKP